MESVKAFFLSKSGRCYLESDSVVYYVQPTDLKEENPKMH